MKRKKIFCVGLITIMTILFFTISYGNLMECKVVHRSLKYGVISKCESKTVECYLSNDNGSNESRLFCLKK